MDTINENALKFMKSELKKAQIEVSENRSRREGVDFIIKTNTGNYHELYLQPIDRDKDLSVKILKQNLGEPKDNFWIALVLFMEEIEPVLYLIPTMKLTNPDNHIFIDNDLGENFKYLSNWEIKVFIKAMPELSKFALSNMVSQL